jgi:hypothetical protein
VPEEQIPKTAKSMVNRLMVEGEMTAEAISDALEGRVSRRTIYRWAKGESDPQQTTDLGALQRLFVAKFPA